MGTYVCEAFNGIPPNDTQEFRVHVYCKCELRCQLTDPPVLSFSHHPGGGDRGGRLPGPDHHAGVRGGGLAQGRQLLGEGRQGPGRRQ